MARETYVEKGRRYVSESRLVVTLVTGNRIAARCRGAGEVYSLGHHPETRWFCSCSVRGTCSHLAALQLVTDLNATESPRD